MRCKVPCRSVKRCLCCRYGVVRMIACIRDRYSIRSCKSRTQWKHFWERRDTEVGAAFWNGKYFGKSQSLWRAGTPSEAIRIDLKEFLSCPFYVHPDKCVCVFSQSSLRKPFGWIVFHNIYLGCMIKKELKVILRFPFQALHSLWRKNTWAQCQLPISTQIQILRKLIIHKGQLQSSLFTCHRAITEWTPKT